MSTEIHIWKAAAIVAQPPRRIVDVRQERSVPVLAALHTWLEAEKPKLLPKAALRGAIDYLLNHWHRHHDLKS